MEEIRPLRYDGEPLRDVEVDGDVRPAADFGYDDSNWPVDVDREDGSIGRIDPPKKVVLAESPSYDERLEDLVDKLGCSYAEARRRLGPDPREAEEKAEQECRQRRINKEGAELVRRATHDQAVAKIKQLPPWQQETALRYLRIKEMLDERRRTQNS